VVVAGRPHVGAPPEHASGRAPAPYEHALADAAFRDRIGRRYAGAHDLLDALWWVEHPQEPGPSGTAAPVTVLRAVRRSLYDRAPALDVLDRVAALAAAERADREALDAALREAEPMPALEPRASAPALPVAAAPRRRTSQRWAAAIATAALVTLAVVGWTRGSTAPQAPTVGDRLVLIQTSATTPDALSLFTSVATPSRRVTARRLAVVAGTSVVAEVARRQVCLELRTRQTVSSACGSISAFRMHGLELPQPTGSPDIAAAWWSPDGRLRLLVSR
jgi:hypothetical protein